MIVLRYTYVFVSHVALTLFGQKHEICNMYIFIKTSFQSFDKQSTLIESYIKYNLQSVLQVIHVYALIIVTPFPVLHCEIC